MQIFLMWPNHAKELENLEPAAVARRLKTFYQPLFKPALSARILRTAQATAVYLEIPVTGWTPPYYQEDAAGWALSLDFPIDAERRLHELTGERPAPAQLLPALGRALEQNGTALLSRLTPPFTLLWSGREAAPLRLQNDGLGFSQIFEYRRGETWALTNKIFALPALGLPLQPVPEEWAVRCTLGWFPLELTGYAHLSTLKPGTRITVDQTGYHQTRHDVLGDWLAPRTMSVEECLELGRASILDYLGAAAPHWTRASAGLTGGWDSRAIAATLLREGHQNYYLRTRGTDESHEVHIASKLAALAGVPHRVQQGRAMPPPTDALLRRTFESAIRWQAGYIDPKIHKLFLNRGRRLTGGDVNIMGQHGEIGRGFYIKRIGALTLEPAQFEEHLIRYAMSNIRPFLRPRYRDAVHETIRTAYRAAERYNLQGCDRLDFFYLHERTRRWASGGQHAQPGKVIAPFLNPGYIRAAYNLPAPLRPGNPFHQQIINCCRPDWNAVPYLESLDKPAAKMLKREYQKLHHESRLARHWNALKSRLESFRYPAIREYTEKGRHNFNAKAYWHCVGQPLMKDILAHDAGLWSAIYEPAAVRAAWDEAPDDLAILYFVERLCE